MMGGRGGGSPASRQAPAASRDTGPSLSAGEAVLEAWQALHRNEWVSLTSMRSLLNGSFTREEQDAALVDLVKQKKIHLIPEENQKSITARDRENAFTKWGETFHLYTVNQ